MNEKSSNPKDLIGSDKLPLHLWPSTATALGSIAMLNGALKYGRSNFRAVGVRASIYYDAARRHLDAWFEGEENDPDDGVPHLAAALACIAIIVDASAADKLTDDRMLRGGYRDFLDGLTPLVKVLKERHAGKTPKHYVYGDQTRDDVLPERSLQAARELVSSQDVQPLYGGTARRMVLGGGAGSVGGVQVPITAEEIWNEHFRGSITFTEALDRIEAL